MEQKIRAILFYLAVITFFILLPFILLYSFGYKLDLNRFRIAKTGLIYVKSIPDGANVFLNGKNLKKTTPLSIEGLMPGEYKLLLELEAYYPWQQTVSVFSGKTTYLDSIVLFTRNPRLDKVNILDLDNFYIFPFDKEYAYCISDTRNAIYKVRLNSKEHEANLLCDQLDLPSDVKELFLSPDKNKLFFFRDNRLEVIYLPAEKLDYQQTKINNFSIIETARIAYAFWYSDSGRIIVGTDKEIKIYELLGQGRSNTVSVLELHDNRPRAFYDYEEDTLYFTDVQKGADGKWHRGLYRLDVGKKSLISFLRDIEDNIKP